MVMFNPNYILYSKREKTKTNMLSLFKIEEQNVQ